MYIIQHNPDTHMRARRCRRVSDVTTLSDVIVDIEHNFATASLLVLLPLFRFFFEAADDVKKTRIQ